MIYFGFLQRILGDPALKGAGGEPLLLLLAAVHKWRVALYCCVSCAFDLIFVCFMSFFCLFHVLCMIATLGLFSRYAKGNKEF